MNSTQIFEMALGLEKPWYVKEIKMDQAEGAGHGQIDIYLDFEKGHRFAGGKVYDTMERMWQHLNFFQHTCFLHARVPRVENSTGKVETVQVPWARPGSGFTLLFEAFGMLLIESEMPVNKASGVLDIYPQRLWNIFSYWIKKAYNSDEQSGVKVLGIDETSSKKGHRYVTVAVDMEERRVVHAVPGKGADTIGCIQQHLEARGCEKEQIEQTCIDMSPSFISGILEHFPKASITFDRFHVVKIINEAMDKVRKQERHEFGMLKGYKYNFLKNDKNLSQSGKEAKYNILTLFPTIANAYRLKEMFNEFWSFKSMEEAGGYLTYWCDLVEESGIQPFKKAAKTLLVHWTGIVNYAETKLNNGILEGINSKIQLAKKRARGYRNIDNFINMIYFIAGKLKFDYPQYSI
ncbi:ISL3 family transposase [Echinicola soli]|uniref:ISL3 family transposase n=1 Tax=Echinicola soli TaxID=2591634 RepID=A0A514CN57_9BACT|nr:ISL3 family transposase [Echinicola soli]QDH81238.1 ISL3 family transposase [Echinicola soli]